MVKCSNYFKARDIIALSLNMFRKKHDNVDNINKDQEDAENMIFRHYQNKEKDYVQKFKGNIYHKEERNGVTVLRGRKTPSGDSIMKLVPKNPEGLDGHSAAQQAKAGIYGSQA